MYRLSVVIFLLFFLVACNQADETPIPDIPPFEAVEVDPGLGAQPLVQATVVPPTEGTTGSENQPPIVEVWPPVACEVRLHTFGPALVDLREKFNEEGESLGPSVIDDHPDGLGGDLMFLEHANPGWDVVEAPPGAKVIWMPEGDPTLVNTYACVEPEGVYRFKLTHDDGEFVASDTVVITVHLPDGEAPTPTPHPTSTRVPTPTLASTSTPVPTPTSVVEPTPTSAPTFTPEPTLICINTGDVESLDTLPGIGPTLAIRIINYRTENGPFVDLDDLELVSGIGPLTVDNLRPFASLC